MANRNPEYILPSGAGYNLFLTTCRDETLQPNNSGIRVRRSSRFKSFNGQSWTNNTGTDPIPLRSVVLTASPAQFARLLLLAYRNRHIRRQPIETVNREPRVFLNQCCRNQIIVEERLPRSSDGRRPTRQGDTECVVQTIYENCVCSPEQIEQALRDMCRVENAIASGASTFASIQSGCPGCPAVDLPPSASACIACAPKLATDGNPYVPAGPNTSLTEDDIVRIVKWYKTGVPFEPPAE